MNYKAYIVFDITIANEADSHFKIWVVFLDVIYDLF